MLRNLLLGYFCVATSSAFAQTNQRVTAEQGITIHKTSQPVKLDGVLDEACWLTADIATDFTPNFPVDTGRANAHTTIRLTFDQNYLYVAAVCDQKRSTYTVQTLRRDFGPGTSDVLNVLIDPFKDGLNGFIFSVNPLNVQREALIDNGNNLSFEWDNVWKSAVSNTDDQWIVEMAIPFKTLRYQVTEGENTWHFNFLRTRLNPWEVSTWRPVPQQYLPNNLAFCGDVRWAEKPPQNRTAVALIPYLSGGFARSYTRDAEYKITDRPDRFTRGIGGDVKIGVTPSLNLDLTVNPDFSQVEVDRQVANVSRFQLFFPERRQFFLENRDLFATFGFPNTRPFFSRQIGLADTSLNQEQRYSPVPILYGARLSGKLNDDWRIGVLNTQTRRLDISEQNVLPSANYTVATAQRKLFSRSVISGIVANKAQNLRPLTEGQRERFQPWNTVAGAEFNFYSKDNRWEAESYYHRSFSPDADKRGASMAQFIGYDVRKFALRSGIQRTDTSYTAAIGFVPRTGVQGIYNSAEYRWYPATKRINTVNLAFDNDMTTNLHFGTTDVEMSLGSNIGFRDQSSLGLAINQTFTKLFDPFDPSNSNETPLPAGNYRYYGISGEYNSSSSYDFQAQLECYVGGFYNGRGANIDGTFQYRIQPYGIIRVNYSYFQFQLPQPYARTSLFLLGPSVELALSKSLFMSTFFQYNTQANNFNINARLQWRFAPVSDLFLVYTDNSYANSIQNTPIRFYAPKNKALVLKAVYWLNI